MVQPGIKEGWRIRQGWSFQSVPAHRTTYQEIETTLINGTIYDNLTGLYTII